ncbi:Monoacylglycerol lipase [compost metagenome]
MEAYRKDPLVHNRITARLAQFIDSNGPRVVSAAPQWRVPTLLMYAGADSLVQPAGSRAFAAAAPREKVHSQAFEKLYHEIFNEVDPSAVYGTLKAWLEVQAPAS